MSMRGYLERKAIRFGVLLGLLGIALVLGLHSPAQAGPLTIRITDGVTLVTCADGDGCDLNPLAGKVSVLATVGAWSLAITSAATYPAIGSPSAPELDLNTLQTPTGAGSITITTSQDNYNSGDGTAGFNLTVGGTSTMAGGSTTAFNYYLDDGNVPFAETTLLGSFGPFGPGAFSDSSIGSASVIGTYSLTLKALLVATTGGGSVSFNQNILFRAPEPAAASLYGLGLGVVALLGWRKRVPAVA